MEFKSFCGRKPPEDIAVNAKLKELKNLISAKLNKKMTS